MLMILIENLALLEASCLNERLEHLLLLIIPALSPMWQ